MEDREVLESELQSAHYEMVRIRDQFDKARETRDDLIREAFSEGMAGMEIVRALNNDVSISRVLQIRDHTR